MNELVRTIRSVEISIGDEDRGLVRGEDFEQFRLRRREFLSGDLSSSADGGDFFLELLRSRGFVVHRGLELLQRPGDGVVVRAAARTTRTTEPAASAPSTAAARATEAAGAAALRLEAAGPALGTEAASSAASSTEIVVVVFLLIGRSESPGPARTAESAGCARATRIVTAAGSKSAASPAAAAPPSARTTAEAAAIIGATEDVVGAARPSASAAPTKSAGTAKAVRIGAANRLHRCIHHLLRRHHIAKQRANHFPFLVSRLDIALDRFNSKLIDQPTTARTKSSIRTESATAASAPLRHDTQRRQKCGRRDSNEYGFTVDQACILD
jgi:hypothetical protein